MGFSRMQISRAVVDSSHLLAPSSKTPAGWMEWLGVVGSVATIISLALYLRERRKRRDQETMMLGFLHGIKAAVEGVAQHAPTLRPVVVQINDMLSRLQSPRTP